MINLAKKQEEKYKKKLFNKSEVKKLIKITYV